MTSIEQRLAEALVATGFRLWITSNNNTIAAQRLRGWMERITRGNLVVEISSSSRGARAIDRIGDLLAIVSGHEFTIHTLDGRDFRWENAMFVRIPRNAAEDREIFLLSEQS